MTMIKTVPVEIVTAFVTTGTSVLTYSVCNGGYVSLISGISSPLIITFGGSSQSPIHVASGVASNVVVSDPETIEDDVIIDSLLGCSGSTDEDEELDDDDSDVEDGGDGSSVGSDADDDEDDDDDGVTVAGGIPFLRDRRNS